MSASAAIPCALTFDDEMKTISPVITLFFAAVLTEGAWRFTDESSAHPIEHLFSNDRVSAISFTSDTGEERVLIVERFEVPNQNVDCPYPSRGGSEPRDCLLLFFGWDAFSKRQNLAARDLDFQHLKTVIELHLDRLRQRGVRSDDITELERIFDEMGWIASNK